MGTDKNPFNQRCNQLITVKSLALGHFKSAIGYLERRKHTIENVFTVVLLLLNSPKKNKTGAYQGHKILNLQLSVNKNRILSGNLASTILSKVPIFVPHNPKAVPITIVTVVRVLPSK